MAYKNGETTYLTKENELKVNEENLDYLIESPWKAVIESFCETPTNYHRELTTELVLSEAIEKPIERQTRYDQMQVATILKNLGYEKKRRGSRGLSQMGLHSRLGACLNLCVRLVHAMDTANNVRTCDIKRVYSVYTFYYKV